jgi:D-alanyl-lipoteichoic acid acyltransferase DltB (MBOAT superfamily)
LKSEPLARTASAALRTATRQDASLASALDLRWLGYSYLAFRLLHVLRDAQEKKRYPASLPEFLSYALFFPAYTSGPIDRLPRFLTDLRQEQLEQRQNLQSGGLRLLQGAVKKYVLADTLALFSLNAANALQVSSPWWMWLLLYAYALRLYLDFSGYTDIAIGLGRFFGIRLPENFNAPYLKTNLTSFWNAWHITLAQWFRAYFFNPLTRWLRTRPAKPPIWTIILVGQVVVMLLIGLWHGLTWNFALWGLWHAAGLFVHNRWSEWQRARGWSAPTEPWKQRMLAAGGWLLTFNFASLGWVWFALPDMQSSLHVLQVLLGLKS